MRQETDIPALFQRSLLAAGMGREEISDFLASSRVHIMEYTQGDIVFHDGDLPRYLYVLLAGEVHIRKDSFSGRHIFISEIAEPGDVFGEVYLLLGKPYDMYVEALRQSLLLAIESMAFSLTEMTNSPAARHVQKNLMEILARKAYFMHSKLKILTSGSLRERIARFLFWESESDGRILLSMNRETWAAYLSVARPSLSRELSAMQREGILSVSGREIRIVNRNKFEEYL